MTTFTDYSVAAKTPEAFKADADWGQH